MEYKKCLVQLDEVLSYLSEEDLNKIPNEIRDSIKEQKDSEYIWEYDEDKNLSEQNLDRNTVAMLSYLNMEYLLNDKQKEYMQKLHEFNERKLEQQKQEKYNPNDIFKPHNQDNTSSNLPAETNKFKWYQKVFIFIKKIIKK